MKQNNSVILKSGGSFFIIFLMILVAGFIYRAKISKWVNNDPEIIIPKEMADQLGLDSSSIKLKGVFDTYKSLESKVLELEKKVNEASKNGTDKINDLTKQLSDAKEALNSTKDSLEKLNKSGENIKNLFSTQKSGGK